MYFPRLKGLESYYCQNPNPITTNSTQHNLSLVREAVKKKTKTSVKKEGGKSGQNQIFKNFVKS